MGKGSPALFVALLTTVAASTSGGCKKTSPTGPPDSGDTDPASPRSPTDPDASEPIRLDLYGDPIPEGAVARIGSVRMLTRGIETMVFSANGEKLYSNSATGYTIWDATTARRVVDLPLGNAYWPLALSPSEEQMATGVLGGRVQLWDLEKKQTTFDFRAHGKELTGLCFLKENLLATAGEDGLVQLWQLTDKEAKQVDKIQGEWSEVSAMACGPAGKLLLWGTRDGSIHWYAPGDPTWKSALGRAPEPITAVAISGDGTRVAAASEDKNIYTWPRRDGGEAADPVVIPAHEGTIASLSFSRTGGSLYSAGGDRFFREWDVQTGKLVRDIEGVPGLDAQYVIVSPSGRLLASWSKYHQARGTESSRFWLWDAQSGDLLLEPERHRGPITSVSVSPDSRKIATASADRTVRVWSAQTGKELAALVDHEGRVNELSWHSDGQIWSAGEDARLRIWTPTDKRSRTPIEPVGGEITAFAVTRNGSYVATGDRTGRVWLYNVKTGKKLRGDDKGLFSSINDLGFTRNDRELVIAGSDNTILVVDVESGRETAKLRPPVVSNLALAFSPGGKYMASATSDHIVDLWTTNPWAQVRALEGHDGTVRTVAFSPDGKYLASGGNDRTVHLWELESGTIVSVLKGHEGTITDLAFSPDSTMLVTGSDDRSALVWRLRTKDSVGLRGDGILDAFELAKKAGKSASDPG